MTGRSPVRLLHLAATVCIGLILTSCAIKRPVSRSASGNLPQKEGVQSLSLKWTEVATPEPAGDIFAVGNVFWICGAEEMIASSSDGGNTWTVKHQRKDGAILLHISFLDSRTGFAAGTSGAFLSTIDGGKTWRSYKADDDIQRFAFADVNNGIAVFGGIDDATPHLDGIVKLTHDGGRTWTPIPALSSEALRPYTQVLSVATLDALHYLMIRRQPEIEDVFVVTQNGGQTWKIVHPRNDATNREFPLCSLIHSGEYWVYGWELVNRQSMGGYNVGLTMHSGTGEKWSHVNTDQHGGDCKPWARRLYDGAVASVYEERTRYWNVPQDSTMTWAWAMIGNRVCTINTVTECGPAIPTDKPQPVLWRNSSAPFDKMPPKSQNLAFVRDCLSCRVDRIMLDPGLDWQGTVVANFDVDSDGSIMSLFLDGKLDGRLRDRIENQVQRWMLKVPSSKATQHRAVPIDIRCIDTPGALAIDGCRLFPGKDVAHSTVATKK